MLDVIEVKHLDGHRLEIAFENGERGIVDLKNYALKGGVFVQFSNLDFFRQVRVNKDLGTICWPGGADIAPETLHQMVRGPA